MVGGVVTHRQRPATAGGTTFLNLEDETGLINVIVSKGVLGPLPPIGSHLTRPGGPRPPPEGRGRGQRDGRAAGASPGGWDPLSRDFR